MLRKTPYSVSIDIIDQAISDMPTLDFRLALNEPTGNFFYDPWKIKSDFKGTIWETILESLPDEKGEARIIKLDPGKSYLCHSDIDDRWHLSLTGIQSYLIDFDNREMHSVSKDGIWYEMDAGKLHTAANFGQVSRYQLVIRKLLVNSQSNNLTSVMIRPSRDQYDYRYVFDNTISPWLNRVSKQGFLSNFKFDNLEVSFNLDKSQINEFKKIITDDFEVTYE
jgi:hypothetical protein